MPPGRTSASPPLHVFLDRLAACLRAALGRDVVGLYLYGSLTQDAFHPRRSDVDCVALLRRRLSAGQVRRLRASLDRLARAER